MEGIRVENCVIVEGHCKFCGAESDGIDDGECVARVGMLCGWCRERFYPKPGHGDMCPACADGEADRPVDKGLGDVMYSPEDLELFEKVEELQSKINVLEHNLNAEFLHSETLKQKIEDHRTIAERMDLQLENAKQCWRDEKRLSETMLARVQAEVKRGNELKYQVEQLENEIRRLYTEDYVRAIADREREMWQGRVQDSYRNANTDRALMDLASLFRKVLLGGRFMLMLPMVMVLLWGTWSLGSRAEVVQWWNGHPGLMNGLLGAVVAVLVVVMVHWAKSVIDRWDDPAVINKGKE